MRGYLFILVALMLSGCVSGYGLEPGIPRVRPLDLNKDPALYDGKTVYVSGTLNTRGHWWDFNLENRGGRNSDKCLNLGNIHILAANRERFDRRQVILKGVFSQGEWKDSLGACDGGNGIGIDEADLAVRYRALIRGAEQ